MYCIIYRVCVCVCPDLLLIDLFCDELWIKINSFQLLKFGCCIFEPSYLLYHCFFQLLKIHSIVT